MTEQHLGKVIDGRYRLDELLGEGAAGAVYAATQLSVDRTVAVKILHAADSDEFASRFQEEARAIGKLNHTNIITLHDFGFDDELGAHYMVTEFAEGVPLSERMREVMSTELVMKIALEVASAMHHAHAQGILHRDLKPENVILTRADGRVDVAKVLDFGLAELYDPAEHETPPASASATLTTMDDYAEEALQQEDEVEEIEEEAPAAAPLSLGALAGDREPGLPDIGSTAGKESDEQEEEDEETGYGEEPEGYGEEPEGYGEEPEDSVAEDEENEPATAILPPLDLSGDSRADQAEPDSSDETKPGETE